jgi:agmatine/peptidylarginine deiminase
MRTQTLHKIPVKLLAEWHKQHAVLLTWPHENTDWKNNIEEVQDCYSQIARHISHRQQLIISAVDKSMVIPYLEYCKKENIHIFEIKSNDSWTRDHGPLSILDNDRIIHLDFKFNGWGLKFAADKDNLITFKLHEQNAFPDYEYKNMMNFVLEGGSIESDGQGTIMTTSKCLLSPNRNGHLTKTHIENLLKKYLGAENILWLEHGELQGDDTDAHIDTLARFCPDGIITYVQCTDTQDEHYNELKLMESGLRDFKNTTGERYKLVPLPMVPPVFEGKRRLPATYANFLITNEKVLVPFYQKDTDQQALNTLQSIFPDREAVGINALPLIKQHGSIHCVTMQIPKC